MPYTSSGGVGGFCCGCCGAGGVCFGGCLFLSSVMGAIALLVRRHFRLRHGDSSLSYASLHDASIDVVHTKEAILPFSRRRFHVGNFATPRGQSF